MHHYWCIAIRYLLITIDHHRYGRGPKFLQLVLRCLDVQFRYFGDGLWQVIKDIWLSSRLPYLNLQLYVHRHLNMI